MSLKKCVVCKKDMPADAGYCTECENYQSWVRHVFAWSGIAGASLGVIALIGGVGAIAGGAKALQEIAFPPSAAVAISELICTSSTIGFVAVNAGGRPAHLYDLKLNVDDGGSSYPFDVPLKLDEKKVAQNDILQSTISLPSGRYLPTASGSGQCTLHLTLKAIDPTGKLDEPKADCTCPAA